MKYALIVIDNPCTKKREVTDSINALELETYKISVARISDIGSKSINFQLLEENVVLLALDEKSNTFSELIRVLREDNRAAKYTIFQTQEIEWTEVSKNEV